MEIGHNTSTELKAFEFDVALRLDIKQFPTAEGDIGHQLMLVVLEVNPRIKEANFEIHHLIDLGVLRFTTKDPDFDEDVICRVENKRDLWVSTESVRQVWDGVIAEIEHYKQMEVVPPYADFPRALRIAIAGIKYFNGFISPDTQKVPTVYLSEEAKHASRPPQLFR